MACLNGYSRKIKTESHYKNDIETQFSPPATRSRRNKHIKKLIPDDTSNEGHITNYFQVVSSIDRFGKQYDSKLYEAKSEVYDGDFHRHYSDFDNDHFRLDLSEINEIIYSDNGDSKKTILNNIFKRDNVAKLNNGNVSGGKDKAANGITNGIKTECINIDEDDDGGSLRNDNDDDNTFDLPNVRLSPRKHASTLQRCVMVKENVKTPHRISLCENPESPSHRQITFRPNKHRTRRRLNTKLSKPKSNKNMTDLTNAIKTESVTSNVEIHINGITKEKLEIKSVIKSECKINGIAMPGENRKLTEYFPVRRSVRKTKKEVMEQKLKDIELAIEEQREEGLEVVSFEGKGRGIIASRKFHRGEFVVEYAGELVDIAEARQREARYAEDCAAGCYMYYFRHNDQHYCIDATAESGRLGRLVNHSRNGNLITKSILMKAKPHLVLIANQDINSGDEITYDYGDRSKESLQHHPWLAL